MGVLKATTWGPLFGPAGGSDGLAWLRHVRVLADIALFVACADVAWLILGLYRHRRSVATNSLAVPPLVGLFGVLVFLGGAAHMGIDLMDETPARPIAIAMKVFVALMWVIIAGRLPSLYTYLAAAADSDSRSNRSQTSSQAVSTFVPVGATPTSPVDQLAARARILEQLILSDNWLLDRASALRELSEILADLEALRCKK